MPNLEEKIQTQHTFFATKNSSNEGHLDKSHFIVKKPDGTPFCQFYIENTPRTEPLQGGYAESVEKAQVHPHPKGTKPALAVKVFFEYICNNNMIAQSRMAARSAYYHRLLGRTGFAFRHNGRQYLVSDWIEGNDIFASQHRATELKISDRIVKAIHLAYELKAIHQAGLIHHDIKPIDIILGETLSFVDLDSLSPPYEPPIFNGVILCCQVFAANAKAQYDLINERYDAHLHFNEKTDIHSLGISLASLFPEIFEVAIVKKKANIINEWGEPDKYIQEKMVLVPGIAFEEHPALRKLLYEMTIKQPSSPETIEECIERLKNALHDYPNSEWYLRQIHPPKFPHALTPEETKKTLAQIEEELRITVLDEITQKIRVINTYVPSVPVKVSDKGLGYLKNIFANMDNIVAKLKTTSDTTIPERILTEFKIVLSAYPGLKKHLSKFNTNEQRINLFSSFKSKNLTFVSVENIFPRNYIVVLNQMLISWSQKLSGDMSLQKLSLDDLGHLHLLFTEMEKFILHLKKPDPGIEKENAAEEERMQSLFKCSIT